MTMKKVIDISFHFLFLCLFFSCVKEGPAGKNSLISIVSEPMGKNCTGGGIKIMCGIDANENSILDNNEVQNTKYWCNGINGVNGVNSITQYEYEPDGLHCSSGGYKISSGLDLNSNNILDLNEVQNSIYVCNGETTGDYDKQIILLLASGNYGADYEAGVLMAHIPDFDISNYLNVDSIVFGAYMWTSNPNVSCFLELYDLTHNAIINNTLLVSNSKDREWKTTAVNFINDLPKNPFTLGTRLRPQNNGNGAYMTIPQIRIYRK